MSDSNPFGGLGGEGGFDLNAMLEQAQQMQAQLVAAQEELAATTVEGCGRRRHRHAHRHRRADRGRRSRPGAFDAGDAESLTDLGDLVVAAYRDGKAKVDELGLAPWARSPGVASAATTRAGFRPVPGGFGV